MIKESTLFALTDSMLHCAPRLGHYNGRYLQEAESFDRMAAIYDSLNETHSESFFFQRCFRIGNAQEHLTIAKEPLRFVIAEIVIESQKCQFEIGKSRKSQT